MMNVLYWSSADCERFVPCKLNNEEKHEAPEGQESFMETGKHSEMKGLVNFYFEARLVSMIMIWTTSVV